MAALADNIVSVKIADKPAFDGLTTQLTLSIADTETGRVTAVSGNVRILSADEPEGVTVQVGDIIEIKRASDAEYRSVRVLARTDNSGAVRFDIGPVWS